MITFDLANELFEYRDGSLYWKISRSNRIKVGSKVGSLTNGYLTVRVDGKLINVHRIVYLMHYGHLPTIVDHVNGDKLDNQIENLRECTHRQNCRNKPKNKNNATGIKGVCLHKARGKYIVKVGADGKEIYCGYYDDLDLAELVAIEARNKYHGEFANHG